jgi:hypothetical protein
MIISRSIAAAFSMAACLAWGQVTYTWTDVSPGSGVQVQDVVVHPLDNRLVVRGQFAVDPPAGRPLFSSAIAVSGDAGRSWTVQPAPAPAIAELLIPPGAVPGVVFAGSAGFESEGRVFRSADSGLSWSVVNTRDAGNLLDLFGADPQDSHGLYAMALRLEGDPFLCPGCGGIRSLGATRTVNDGHDWSTPVATGARGLPEGPTPSAPGRLFIGDDGGAMVSVDKGATWSRFQSDLPTPLRWIVPDPLHADVLYAARYDPASSSEYRYVLLRSDDDGLTWREIFRTVGNDPPPVIDPARSNILWKFDYQRDALFRSENRGETWQSVLYPISRAQPGVGLPTTLVVSAAEPGVVYTVQQGRLFRGTPTVARDPVVVEYRSADRYWLTSLDGEAVFEDNRQEDGFARTGARWGAWAAGHAPAGAVGSCRFWPKSETGLRTRVILMKDGDCEWLRADPNWILEAEDEFFALPSADRATCAAGLVAVHRFHNLKADLNHRWVADAGVAQQMRAAGWFDEGVRFCARPLGANE